MRMVSGSSAIIAPASCATTADCQVSRVRASDHPGWIVQGASKRSDEDDGVAVHPCPHPRDFDRIAQELGHRLMEAASRALRIVDVFGASPNGEVDALDVGLVVHSAIRSVFLSVM